ncbi:STAS domain-containing protein [Actinomadura parmotrematis]|uniref:Anti-sigma factor antagonist n=1 Tax=Actinomadura parmotrematis TaxID=2864039 RepID=A0ABS7FNX8_9ACTN|nr:STAS domain-containing protein [Actinomadura parmotrematis]MBW8481945.1 STAS domain-containing protein [Actinomadura parmotrematis]
MDFEIDLLHHGGCTLVRVRGDIDLVSRPVFEESMLGVLDSGRPMIVDMRQVTFCDSTGLNAIVVAGRRSAERDTPMALVALPPRVRRVFRITGMDRYVPVYETLREALGSLGSN